MLLDLDGVLYVEDEPLPGAVEAVAWLAREGVPLLFLTNTTSRPRARIADKLVAMGIDATPGQVLTPVIAAVGWLRRERPGRPALFVPEATAAEFDDLDPLPPGATDGAGAVVVGDLGEGWDYASMNRALRLLTADPPPRLVALGMTRFWRAEDGLRLDAGAFVRAFEYAAGTTAVVTGKPDPQFFEAALDALDLPAAEVVMVGDDVRTDVEGAQRAGIGGILVRTGKFTPADLEGDVRPDAVLDSVAELPGWWPG